jgi:hypothetical protein
VTDCELRNVGFEGDEAVAEVGCGAVEGCVGEVTHRGDRGAECPADVAIGVDELGHTGLAIKGLRGILQ